MNRMSEYDTESYCCCSLRDRCLIFAAQIMGLFAVADVGFFAVAVIINSPEFQMITESMIKPVYGDGITSYFIGAFVLCSVYVIVAVCLIAGILKKRRWLLLVFLIAFGIFVGLQSLGTLSTMISLLRQISTVSVIVAFINLAFSIFYIWGWCSVLLLFRKMKVPASQREMAMSLIPSAKPFTDDVDIEKDGGDSEDPPPQYMDHE